jgi:hypothetical protein
MAVEMIVHGEDPIETVMGCYVTSMNMLLLIVVLLLVFGGGGFTLRPVVGGGGFGLILLICLIVISWADSAARVADSVAECLRRPASDFTSPA